MTSREFLPKLLIGGALISFYVILYNNLYNNKDKNNGIDMKKIEKFWIKSPNNVKNTINYWQKQK